MEKSFVYGIAVTDYNFTGRAEETRRLKANFKGGINSILISPRRYGKTSLVNHVCRNLDGEDLIIVRLQVAVVACTKQILQRIKLGGLAHFDGFFGQQSDY